MINSRYSCAQRKSHPRGGLTILSELLDKGVREPRLRNGLQIEISTAPSRSLDRRTSPLARGANIAKCGVGSTRVESRGDWIFVVWRDVRYKGLAVGHLL